MTIDAVKSGLSAGDLLTRSVIFNLQSLTDLRLIDTAIDRRCHFCRHLYSNSNTIIVVVARIRDIAIAEARRLSLREQLWMFECLSLAEI